VTVGTQRFGWKTSLTKKERDVIHGLSFERPNRLDAWTVPYGRSRFDALAGEHRLMSKAERTKEPHGRHAAVCCCAPVCPTVRACELWRK
jgi:hypothetical protein